MGRELTFMGHRRPIQLHSGKSGDSEDSILSSCSLAARRQACGRSQLTNASAWDSDLEGEAPECKESQGLLTAAAWGECPVGKVWLPKQNILWGILAGPCPVWSLRLASLDFQPSHQSRGTPFQQALSARDGFSCLWLETLLM